MYEKKYLYDTYRNNNIVEGGKVIGQGGFSCVITYNNIDNIKTKLYKLKNDKVEYNDDYYLSLTMHKNTYEIHQYYYKIYNINNILKNLIGNKIDDYTCIVYEYGILNINNNLNNNNLKTDLDTCFKNGKNDITYKIIKLIFILSK